MEVANSIPDPARERKTKEKTDESASGINTATKETIMTTMIACCGLVCSDCPTFIATRNDDDSARAETAAFYRDTYGLDLKPEEINCDGCLSTGGTLIGYCRTCEIRKCCLDRKIENCAVCDHQPCDKLIQFHEFSPAAKKSFDQLKQQPET